MAFPAGIAHKVYELARRYYPITNKYNPTNTYLHSLVIYWNNRKEIHKLHNLAILNKYDLFERESIQNRIKIPSSNTKFTMAQAAPTDEMIILSINRLYNKNYEKTEKLLYEINKQQMLLDKTMSNMRSKNTVKKQNNTSSKISAKKSKILQTDQNEEPSDNSDDNDPISKYENERKNSVPIQQPQKRSEDKYATPLSNNNHATDNNVKVENRKPNINIGTQDIQDVHAVPINDQNSFNSENINPNTINYKRNRNDEVEMYEMRLINDMQGELMQYTLDILQNLNETKLDNLLERYVRMYI